MGLSESINMIHFKHCKLLILGDHCQSVHSGPVLQQEEQQGLVLSPVQFQSVSRKMMSV